VQPALKHGKLCVAPPRLYSSQAVGLSGSVFFPGQIANLSGLPLVGILASSQIRGVMATHPHTPLMERHRPKLVPRARRKPRRHWGRILVLVLVVAAILVGATFFRRQQAPAAAIAAASVPVPVLPGNNDLQVAGVQINRDLAGTGLSLTANITNTGSHSVTGATVTVSFRDKQGQVVEVVDRPIQGISGGNCELTNEFARHPIKPNALRFFCVTLDQVPAAWNRQVPEIQMLNATGQ